jgi:hypothetical protein
MLAYVRPPSLLLVTMKLQIIQLEPYDDVISIRDRLSFVSTERVLLV